MKVSLSLDRCYELLELSRQASYQDARKAYIGLMQRWHPDRFENYPPLQAHAVRMTQEINAAFEVLTEVLPADQSLTDRLFSDSFDSHCADWSAYYTAATCNEFDDADLVPEDEISRSISHELQLHSSTSGFFEFIFSPFKFLTDVSVFFIVERPTVPILAGFVFLASFY